MSMPSLFIAGVEIALQSFPFTQSYTPIGGSTVHRMLNGAGAKQTHWTKLTTTISGDGIAPPGLAAVNWSVPVEILCIAPRSMFSSTNVLVLPTARRTDFADAVKACAIVGGKLQPTTISVVGNTATAVAVAGASGYQFIYFPRLNFYSDGVQESDDVANADFSWTLTAEEV